MHTATQYSPSRRPSVPYSVGDSDEEFSSPPSYSPRDEYNPPQFSRGYTSSISGSPTSPTETVFSNYTVSSDLTAPLAWQAPYENAGILGRQLDERARTPVTGRIPLSIPDDYSRRPSAADTEISVTTNSSTTSDSSYTTNMSQVALMADIYGHLGAYPTEKPQRGPNRFLEAPPQMRRVKSEVSPLRTHTVENVPPVPTDVIVDVVDIPVIVPFDSEVPEVTRQKSFDRGRERVHRRDRSHARKAEAQRPHYDATAHERHPKQNPAAPGKDRGWETPPRSRTTSRGRHHPDRRRQTPYVGDLAPPPLPGRGLPDDGHGNSRAAALSTLTRQASENWSAKSVHERHVSRVSTVDDLEVETPRISTFSYRTEASVYSTQTVIPSSSGASSRPAPSVAGSHSAPAVPQTQTRRHVPTPVYIPPPPSPPHSAQTVLSRTPSARSALSRAPSYKTVESNEQTRSGSIRRFPSLKKSSPKSTKGDIRDSWIDLGPESEASLKESLQRKQGKDLPLTPDQREVYAYEALKRQKQSVEHFNLYSIKDIQKMREENCLPETLASTVGPLASSSTVNLSSAPSIKSSKSGKLLERFRGRKDSSRLTPPSS
ncbi:unnamed protein product [Peniophora sp. CBMAI 1063]|nr:unnamed protein product [Peniophora sp. CBMAI 1063]